jgi:4-amino-4-deoxy-L-arabinose transferase-like glycosyltransferase
MDRLPPHSNRYWPWLLLGFMIILSFFAGLGSGPLFDVDEGAFSEATREMLAGHNYLTTFLNGAPRFDKPINEIAFRLPSALAAAIWAVATFLFVRKERDNEREALLAAVLMTLSLQVTIIAKAAIADGVLNCSLAVTMFAIYRFYRTEKYSAILLAFASIGVGILDKGPIALIIPFVVSLLFFLLEQKFRLWLRAVLNPVAWLIMLLIVLPWYTLEYLDQGMAFIQGFFFKHNVDRFSSSLEGHSGALFYYIPVVLGGIMPSTGLLFTVLFNLRKLLSDPLNRFCVIWFAFVFVFFSLSGTKLPHYMIYGYTPLFLLMARSFTSSKRPALLAIWPALLLLGFAALPFAGTQLLQRAPSLFIKAQLTATLSLMHEQHFSALMAAAAVATLLIQAISAIRPMYRFILSGTLLLMAVNFSVMPIVASVMQEPVRESALLAKREGYKIVMWKVYYPSFLVYSQSLVEKRVPEAGDIVLTTVDHLDKLGNPQLLYRKNGIVLARVPN